MSLRLAHGFGPRLRGLHAWPAWGDQPWGLVFRRCKAVHTGGLAQPLDVVFVDARGGVVRCVPSLAPNRLVWCGRAEAVIELPAAYCGQSGWRARIQLAWASLNMVA
ncbi:DUF192 domain-containing protein [Castellaniella hirudinis]|uniref:DUF192 domain-containing protein n=1 Tax=Castellaniella hirudinis TaxID=1144617 RepID=UPI0039C4DEB1